MGEVIKRQSGGRFIGWYIRYYDSAGKRRMKASKQATFAEARRMLIQIEAQLARGAMGVAEPKSRLTVAELCSRFLAAAHPRAQCAVAYRRAAASALKRILPLVGAVRLDKLHRRDIEDARDQLSLRYRPNTVRAALRALGAALTWAVQQDLITQSPMYKLIRPRSEYSSERLTADEASALLKEAQRQAPSSAAAHSLYIGISLALRLGLRRGEVFGLRWEDVDLKGRRLTVARSFDSRPKNGKSRTLPIPGVLVADLERWQAAGAKLPRVCPLGTHSRLGLSQLLKAAQCKPLARGWHGLRHTFASIFLEHGGSILALKELLGHASLAMSLVYSHLAPGALAGDIEKMKL